MEAGKSAFQLSPFSLWLFKGLEFGNPPLRIAVGFSSVARQWSHPAGKASQVELVIFQMIKKMKMVLSVMFPGPPLVFFYFFCP